MNFKHNITLALIFCLSIAVVWWVFSTSPTAPQPDEPQTITNDQATEATTNQTITNDQQAADEHHQAMLNKFEQLKADRTTLKKKLARLKHKLWNMKFDPETAKTINQDMMAGHQLINNPNLLGAFSSVEEIENEIAKVQFAINSLVAIENIKQ